MSTSPGPRGSGPERAGAGAPEGDGEPFVGREAALAELDAALTRAASGAGTLVLVAGEAGTGKTALLGAFLERALARDPTLSFRGRCAEQHGAGEAFMPFLEALSAPLIGTGRKRLAALLFKCAPTWCLQLPAAIPSAEARETLQRQTIGATKDRMLREIGDVLEAAGDAAPVVVAIEDLQWADPSSVDLLRHLAGRIPRHRIVLIGTFRPSDLEAGGKPFRLCRLDLRALACAREIELGPLSEAEVAASIDARFAPHVLPRELALSLHAKSAGHPLFVSSLLRLLATRGDLARQDGAWRLSRPLAELDLGAPESIRDVVRRKLESLDAAERTALQYASVMGDEFLSPVLARLLELDELVVEERLQRLERTHRLIHTLGEQELPDGTLATRYRFAHSLDREVLEAELVAKRRLLLHRQAATELERLHAGDAARIAPQLALHFEAGRDFEAAVKQRIQAAENAARLYAYTEADRHLARAFELLARLPPAEQGPRLMAIHERRGAVALALGRFGDAAESYGRMLDGARAAGASGSECAALVGLSKALFFSRRSEELAVRAEELLRAAERTGVEALRIDALVILALILQDEGDLDACAALLDEVVGLARGLGQRPSLLASLAYRGCIHYWRSEYAAAESCLAEAAALAAELRDGFLWLMALTFLGLARGNQGRVAAALAALDEGAAMARTNGDRFWLPRLESALGWLHRELQDFETAIAHDREGLRVAREDGVAEAEAAALLNLCVDFTQAGRMREARDVAATLDALSGAGFGWFHGLRRESALAEHQLAVRDLERAARHARQLVAAASQHGARTYRIGGHRLLAEAALLRGDLAEAAGELASASELLADSPIPLIAWKTRATVARLRAAAGDPASAREAWREADGIVRGIADQIDDATLQGAFLGSSSVAEIRAGSDGGAGS